jgi:Zn-dependent protease
MFFQLLQQDPALYFTVAIAVIISITLHELAHGWTAVAFGDRTPIEMDRLTPNPLVHMGWFSIAMVFIIGLGWGAMPVNPSRMRGKYADAYVSAAGPMMNVLIALFSLTLIGVWARMNPAIRVDESFGNTVYGVFLLIGLLNILLALFNLLPVPPLDGSRVLASVFPPYRDWAFTPAMMGVWSAVLIASLFFMGRFLMPVASTIVGSYLRLVEGR